MKKPWMKVVRPKDHTDEFLVQFDARDWDRAAEAILFVRNAPPPGYRVLEGSTDRDDNHKAGQRCRVSIVLQKINRTLPDYTIPKVTEWMRPVADRARDAQKETAHEGTSQTGDLACDRGRNG